MDATFSPRPIRLKARIPAVRRAAFLLLLLLPSVSACGDGDGRPELWIYTSIYPDVIDRMAPDLEARFPDVRFRWYQKGSEQVAARLSIEMEAGGSECDLLMTSDPFYYAELAEAGHLLAYESPAARDVPAAYRDPEHRFTTVRIPVMVIATHPARLGGREPPRAFGDLTHERWRGKVSMGDPLKSGTTFTTVAALVREEGWPFVEALRENDIVAAGGNSAVLQRLETGERPVGVILLENLLPRIAAGAPLAIVYPEDGAVPVPSPIGILASTDQPGLAKRVYDFMFSREMQDAIVAGHMYSPLPAYAPPAGAPPLADLRLMPWDDDHLRWVRSRRDDIKARFREIMRR
ncbi:MAG: ABC transporter substrate-binding protein [Planctomycetota bacterium]|jgi:iron(III) transport system substrate-binding protein